MTAPAPWSVKGIDPRAREVAKELARREGRTAAIRSSPMPVSMEGLGRAIRSPSACWSNCMKTRFQISTNRSPSSSGDPGGPPAMCSPWSQKISEQGPHGPVSPMDQKLSAVPMRMILSSDSPAIFFHSPCASSSEA